jgi:hypothetical protein
LVLSSPTTVHQDPTITWQTIKLTILLVVDTIFSWIMRCFVFTVTTSWVSKLLVQCHLVRKAWVYKNKEFSRKFDLTFIGNKAYEWPNEQNFLDRG